MKTQNPTPITNDISWNTPDYILYEKVCQRNRNHAIWKQRAGRTTFRFDDEFLSTVRYYIGDRKKYSRKLRLLFLHYRDEDCCRIEESHHVLTIKREILAIVAKWQLMYYHHLYSGFNVSPWWIDDCAMSCAHDIQDNIDEWWNCGATVGMY